MASTVAFTDGSSWVLTGSEEETEFKGAGMPTMYWMDEDEEEGAVPEALPSVPL